MRISIISSFLLAQGLAFRFRIRDMSDTPLFVSTGQIPSADYQIHRVTALEQEENVANPSFIVKCHESMLLDKEFQNLVTYGTREVALWMIDNVEEPRWSCYMMKDIGVGDIRHIADRRVLEEWTWPYVGLIGFGYLDYLERIHNQDRCFDGELEVSHVVIDWSVPQPSFFNMKGLGTTSELGEECKQNDVKQMLSMFLYMMTGSENYKNYKNYNEEQFLELSCMGVVETPLAFCYLAKYAYFKGPMGSVTSTYSLYRGLLNAFTPDMIRREDSLLEVASHASVVSSSDELARKWSEAVRPQYGIVQENLRLIEQIVLVQLLPVIESYPLGNSWILFTSRKDVFGPAVAAIYELFGTIVQYCEYCRSKGKIGNGSTDASIERMNSVETKYMRALSLFKEWRGALDGLSTRVEALTESESSMRAVVDSFVLEQEEIWTALADSGITLSYQHKLKARWGMTSIPAVAEISIGRSLENVLADIRRIKEAKGKSWAKDARPQYIELLFMMQRYSQMGVETCDAYVVPLLRGMFEVEAKLIDVSVSSDFSKGRTADTMSIRQALYLCARYLSAEERVQLDRLVRFSDHDRAYMKTSEFNAINTLYGLLFRDGATLQGMGDVWKSIDIAKHKAVVGKEYEKMYPIKSTFVEATAKLNAAFILLQYIQDPSRGYFVYDNELTRTALVPVAHRLSTGDLHVYEMVGRLIAMLLKANKSPGFRLSMEAVAMLGDPLRSSFDHPSRIQLHHMSIGGFSYEKGELALRTPDELMAALSLQAVPQYFERVSNKNIKYVQCGRGSVTEGSLEVYSVVEFGSRCSSDIEAMSTVRCQVGESDSVDREYTFISEILPELMVQKNPSDKCWIRAPQSQSLKMVGGALERDWRTAGAIASKLWKMASLAYEKSVLIPQISLATVAVVRKVGDNEFELSLLNSDAIFENSLDRTYAYIREDPRYIVELMLEFVGEDRPVPLSMNLLKKYQKHFKSTNKEDKLPTVLISRILDEIIKSGDNGELSGDASHSLRTTESLSLDRFYEGMLGGFNCAGFEEVCAFIPLLEAIFEVQIFPSLANFPMNLAMPGGFVLSEWSMAYSVLSEFAGTAGNLENMQFLGRVNPRLEFFAVWEQLMHTLEHQLLGAAVLFTDDHSRTILEQFAVIHTDLFVCMQPITGSVNNVRGRIMQNLESLLSIRKESYAASLVKLGAEEGIDDYAAMVISMPVETEQLQEEQKQLLFEHLIKMMIKLNAEHEDNSDLGEICSGSVIPALKQSFTASLVGAWAECPSHIKLFVLHTLRLCGHGEVNVQERAKMITQIISPQVDNTPLQILPEGRKPADMIRAYKSLGSRALFGKSFSTETIRLAKEYIKHTVNAIGKNTAVLESAADRKVAPIPSADSKQLKTFRILGVLVAIVLRADQSPSLPFTAEAVTLLNTASITSAGETSYETKEAPASDSPIYNQMMNFLIGFHTVQPAPFFSYFSTEEIMHLLG